MMSRNDLLNKMEEYRDEIDKLKTKVNPKENGLTYDLKSEDPKVQYVFKNFIYKDKYKRKATPHISVYTFLYKDERDNVHILENAEECKPVVEPVYKERDYSNMKDLFLKVAEYFKDYLPYFQISTGTVSSTSSDPEESFTSVFLSSKYTHYQTRGESLTIYIKSETDIVFQPTGLWADFNHQRKEVFDSFEAVKAKLDEYFTPILKETLSMKKEVQKFLKNKDKMYMVIYTTHYVNPDSRESTCYITVPGSKYRLSTGDNWDKSKYFIDEKGKGLRMNVYKKTAESLVEYFHCNEMLKGSTVDL